MALHELATNAGKYGALSNGSGQVSIEWTVIDTGGERNIQLSWQEQGGPPVQPPAHKGFG
jgi:two-component sensor histidine kinase